MKKILIFMTDFYGYNKNIIEALKAQGWEVTWCQDRINLNNAQRIYSKINKGYKDRAFSKYFNSCIAKTKGTKFDLILIIFGANFFNKIYIVRLREVFESVPIHYYAWDSVDNFPKIKELFEYSDKAFTFDKNDADNYNVEFLPLFYVPSTLAQCDPLYDCSTVMTFYHEKFESLNAALSVLPNHLNNNFYLKIRDGLYFLMIRLFYRKRYQNIFKYFHLNSLKREEVMELFKNSKAIIDCPLPKQNGLTMRTFEVLSLKRKLITTNISIKTYDFYTPQNIYVIDDSKEMVPLEFLETPFDQNYSIGEDYCISSFIKTLTEQE